MAAHTELHTRTGSFVEGRVRGERGGEGGEPFSGRGQSQGVGALGRCRSGRSEKVKLYRTRSSPWAGEPTDAPVVRGAVQRGAHACEHSSWRPIVCETTCTRTEGAHARISCAKSCPDRKKKELDLSETRWGSNDPALPLRVPFHLFELGEEICRGGGHTFVSGGRGVYAVERLPHFVRY